MNAQIIPSFPKKINKILHKTFKHQEVFIEEIKNEEESIYPNRIFYHVLDKAKNTIGTLVINKAYGCHIEGCDDPSEIRNDFANSAYEEFYYAILFNPDLSIKTVKILEYDSEYGYEICSKRWLKQFRNISPNQINKLHKIDGISGATVSVNSIVNDIINLGFILE